jgi:hypothetical protein
MVPQDETTTAPADPGEKPKDTRKTEADIAAERQVKPDQERPGESGEVLDGAANGPTGQAFPLLRNDYADNPSPVTPVPGYRPQSQANLDLVAQNKHTEERLLRFMDLLKQNGCAEGRWLSIARTHFEQGFMALNRSIMRPARIALPEDTSGR